MKFLIRRIRFAFAGRIMRLIMSVISLLAVGILVVIMISGAVNQRSLFETFFGWAWNSSENIAQGIENGDYNNFVDITDQGVYMKGQSPNGAKDITGEKNNNGEKSSENSNSKDGKSKGNSNSEDNKSKESLNSKENSK